jgi:hypothetical protein
MLRGYGSLWLVRMHESANKVVICTAQDREEAKEIAHRWLGGTTRMNTWLNHSRTRKTKSTLTSRLRFNPWHRYVYSHI